MGEEERNTAAAEQQEECEDYAVDVTTASSWYKKVSYHHAKIFIRTNIESAARSFIAIGYYLKLIRDGELYREEGHESIWDFAQAEYGISKSTASRYMSMNDRFSADGNSPIVDQKYKDFDKSKLQEMLSLTDEQLEQVTPQMKVQEIRAMRQPKEIPYFEMEGQLDFETDFPEVFPEASEAPVVTQPAVIQTTMTLEEMMGEEPGEQQDEEPEVVATSQQTESQDSATIRRFIEAWVEHCPQDFKSAMRAMREGSTQGKKGKQIQEKLAPYGCHYIGDSDYSLDFGSYAVGMDWRVSREKIHLTYDRLAYELLCMYDLWSHEFDEEEPAANYVESAAEKQQTEIEAVPEEQTAPEAPLTDTEIVRIALQEAQELLDNCLMIPGLLPDDENIRKQKFIVEALEGKLVSMEGTAVATVEVEQPELPVLRNNDQRAAFIDNYESWPLWIETQETGERYYRYDLPDGTSFVIKTYHYMQPDYVSGIGVRYTEGYGANEQYILEPGKFFRNCQSNRSSMIEKLKELQKGKNDGKIN